MMLKNTCQDRFENRLGISDYSFITLPVFTYPHGYPAWCSGTDHIYNPENGLTVLRTQPDEKNSPAFCSLYAVFFHKAQGSQFPVVVMPIVPQHYMMLQRNLLYTAITRARKLCVLAGNQKAIGIAVRNNKVASGFTALEWRLGRNNGQFLLHQCAIKMQNVKNLPRLLLGLLTWRRLMAKVFIFSSSEDIRPSGIYNSRENPIARLANRSPLTSNTSH